jgi:hypothetical protein
MRRVRASQLAVVLGYVLAAVAFSWPLPLHIGTHFTGDPGGDTGVYVWNQWVFHQELTTGHNPLATEKILSLTSRVDLTQHNYTAFLNVLALPLIAWLGVVASFNVVFLIVCVLNAVMTYGLARRVTGANRWEAWLAGLAFAWAPAMVARTTGHFSIAAAAALPAFLWCLVNAERSRSTRDAALVGACMAWAALSDAYFGIYCLIIGTLYVGASLFHVSRTARPAPRAWRWAVDVLIVCFGGLIAGLLISGGGVVSVFGLSIRSRTLYTPVLVLTVLAIVRTVMWWRPHFDLANLAIWGPGSREPGTRTWEWRSLIRLTAIAAIACIGPLAPVLYGLTTRVADGRFVSPKIFWRSSPPGVDLLSFITPNPLHPIARVVTEDAQALRPTIFVEYTAALSLVAIAIIVLAMWRARYRPSGGWLAVTIGFALLALGPFVVVAGMNTHVPGPWALLRYVPVIGLARMPTRFSVVAAIGVSVLMAGALAAMGARWPQRRRLIGAIVALLLVFELWPAPRTLYSASISPIYDRIAADPRPVRVLTLPFGVRDGTWETGNFRPRSLFNQTRHGKALIGGYLSRVSPRRVDRMRQDYPTLDALITLSEPSPLGPQVKARLDERGDRLVQQGNVGYVVIDSRFIPPERAQLVIDAFKLIEIQRDQHLALYAPAANR